MTETEEQLVGALRTIDDLRGENGFLYRMIADIRDALDSAQCTACRRAQDIADTATGRLS